MRNWFFIATMMTVISIALMASPLKALGVIFLFIGIGLFIYAAHQYDTGFMPVVQHQTTIYSNDQHLHVHKHFHTLKSMQEGVEVKQTRPDGSNVSIRYLKKYE